MKRVNLLSFLVAAALSSQALSMQAENQPLKNVVSNTEKLVVEAEKDLDSEAAPSSIIAEGSQISHTDLSPKWYDDFYIGAEIGMSSIDDKNKFENPNTDSESLFGGVFVGYKLNPFVSAELGYQYFDDSTQDDGDCELSTAVHQLALSAKVGYPMLNDKLTPYVKIGAAAWMADIGHADAVEDASGFSALAGVGVSYSVTDQLNARFEYQYTNDVARSEHRGHSGYEGDLHHVSLGLEWHFGGKKKAELAISDVQPVIDTPAEPAANKLPDPEILMVTHFEVNKHEIDGTLDFSAAVNALNSNPGKILWVKGHTDSTGTASHNLDLSVKRAQFIAESLEALGVPSDQIIIEGEGVISPVQIHAESTITEEEVNKLNRRVEVYLVAKQ